MHDDQGPVAPDLDTIEGHARDAVEALPAAFLPAARQVAIRVVDWPDDDMLDDLGIDDVYGLTGLYDGIPMTQKSVMDVAQGPDTIWLFRRPILDEWADRGEIGLRALVAHVLVHEMAHHFGWSDADIAAIDPWWE